MASKDRQQRRTKRLARQRKKRANASRPARFGPTTGSLPNLKSAVSWPPGDCYVSDGWDAPGAHSHMVFVRSHQDGRSVAAFVEIDRSGPGVLSARVDSFPTTDSVLAECIRISEASDELAFRGAPPGMVAGAIADAQAHGEAELPQAWPKVEALLGDVEPAEMDVAFGPAPDVKQTSGLLDRLFRYLG